ncbi:MAG: molybdopterin oxidoreductase family protein [Rhodospirillaceae bacterium]
MPLNAPAENDGVNTSPPVADEVKTTTCYMCACRCGIRVFLKDGQVRYIQGNRDHPINKGVLCGKGAAGIMNQLSPARLRKPLKRVGPRGTGDYVEIEWDEALATATKWLGDIRKTDPKKLAFFTGRDQSQSLTGWWAKQFGTPNYAAHGGFCSVNMAVAGLYSIGGSFWEFGEPDWDHTRLFLMFGVAEDHDSNPIKIGLGKLKERGAKVVAINPARTGYAAIADDWIGIRPGTDGLLVLSLVHELLRAGKIDLDYLLQYTNASWLVQQTPGQENDGLFMRGTDGTPLIWDRNTNTSVPHTDRSAKPSLAGVHSINGLTATPVFQLIADRYTDETYAPENVAERCGVDANTIKQLAAEIADAAFNHQVTLPVAWTDTNGIQHETMTGRPVAMHAMRGISAHSNGFQTCRALHVLQMLIGAVDTPGSFRYKPPYPKPAPPGPMPAGKTIAPNTALKGMPLGFTTGPEDLLVSDDGKPLRIDKAFSWENPMSAHGAMHRVIANAASGDPYPIDTLFLYMANMAWNSSMDTAGTLAALTAMDPETGAYKIPHIIYSDAYASETISYADLILPDTTYLERWDCISLLDRPISDAEGAGDAIRQPIVQPDRDVRPFQTVLLDLGARLGLPGFVAADGTPAYPGGYEDYIVNHERAPGVGPLAGWRGKEGETNGRGVSNPDQLKKYIENGCFWRGEIPENARYYKMANQSYLDWAVGMGFLGSADPIIMQLYSEPVQKFRNAARGLGPSQPPANLKDRVEQAFDPLPVWQPTFEDDATDSAEYPLHALTQRPMHHYHSWGSQNAWLRQITSQNRLFVHHDTAAKFDITDDDWVWVESRHGRVKGQVKLIDGVNKNTVWTWNAIGKRGGTWGLDKDSPEVKRGFLLNHIIPEKLNDGVLSNSDPVTGQAAWFDLRVRISKAEPDEQGITSPLLDKVSDLPGTEPRPQTLQFGKSFRDQRETSQ